MSRNKIIVSLAVIASFALSAVFVRHLASKRIVVRAVAPNGLEFCIIQRFAGGDLFNTSAFYRAPGSQWNWFYYDHEDWYWNRGRTEIDPTNHLIKVFRGKSLAATFNWQTEVFTRGTNWKTTRINAVVPFDKNPWEDF